MIQSTKERLAGSARRKALGSGFVLAVLMAASLLVAKPAHAASFIVNSTDDPGNGICDVSECTLREAIKAANNNPGPDIIRFNIPGSGVKTIKPGANGYGSLPEITDQVIIAGYSQPGATENTLAQGGTDAKLLIELDGSSAGASADGLQIKAKDSVVNGLIINRFDGNGLKISPNGSQNNAANVRIEGNFIGTDPTGTKSLGNGSDGVTVEGANGATIGGSTPDKRNLISGAGGAGVRIGGNSTGARVQGNSIFSNSDLGIDLKSGGPTLNDPGDVDSGPNGLQNFPVLTSAKTTRKGTTIKGNLDSAPNKIFTVEFFSNPPGENEGKTFVGSVSVSTDASGKGTFAFKPAQKVPKGQFITATATDPNGNTSEFSVAKKVVRKRR